jgi:hypothetical protein
MPTLYDKIRYEHKPYSDLTDSIERNEIEVLVEKLKPLETEIVNDQKGRITIMKPGNIFIDSFDPALAKEIGRLINGRD